MWLFHQMPFLLGFAPCGALTWRVWHCEADRGELTRDDGCAGLMADSTPHGATRRVSATAKNPLAGGAH